MASATYQLSVQGVHNRQYVENVIAFFGDNLSTSAIMVEGLDLIASFEGNLLSAWLGCMPSSYEVTRLTARRLRVATGPVAHKQYQFGQLPGTDGSAAASYQLCPAIFLIPPMGIKSGGKIFMPAISTAAVNGNLLQAAYLAAIDNFMQLAMTNFGTTAVTWQLAIYSRLHDATSLVLDYNMSTRLGFQIKRQKPVGG